MARINLKSGNLENGNFYLAISGWPSPSTTLSLELGPSLVTAVFSLGHIDLHLHLHFTSLHSLTQIIYILDRRESEHIVDNFTTKTTSAARLTLGPATWICTFVCGILPACQACWMYVLNTASQHLAMAMNEPEHENSHPRCGNKSSKQGLSLNRSQCGGCSTEYNTLSSSQVVCKWFCAPTLHRVWSGFSNRRTVTYGGETAYWGRICVGTAAAYVRLPTLGSKDIVAITRRDSDLEAFSHKPSDGSFAPLACRPSTWTNCLNLRFLSYWAGLLLQQRVISRVKLTCLTTV